MENEDNHKVIPSINVPRFMPGASEIEQRRDFIWYCREHKWPEEIQDQVLRHSLPDVENALVMIKIHGPLALAAIQGVADGR
jgi:hypothetical protein